LGQARLKDPTTKENEGEEDESISFLRGRRGRSKGEKQLGQVGVW